MSVFKIEKNRNYTVMSNYHLRDKNLSLKAKGLLSFMLSLPDDWDYSMNGLVSVSKEGIKSIRNILQELQNYGYLVIDKKQNKLGQFQYEYLIYENPRTQKGDMDLGDVEKGIQINTNKQIDKEDKTKLSSFFDELNNLTKTLVKHGYVEEDDIELLKYDNLFEQLLEEYNYKELIKITNYIIDKVISRKFIDEGGNLIENKYGYFKSAMLNNISKVISNEIEWDGELNWFKCNCGEEIQI